MPGRIRTVKPELIDDAKFATLSDDARLLYYGLLGVVDDAGRAVAEPGFLHARAFWGRPRSLARVRRARADLVSAEFVSVYTVSGQEYLEIPRWLLKGSLTHQRIEHPQPSSLPAPSSISSTNVPRTFHESSTNIPAQPEPEPEPEPEPKPRPGTESEQNAPAPLRLDPPPDSQARPGSPRPPPSKLPESTADREITSVLDHHQVRFQQKNNCNATHGAGARKRIRPLVVQHGALEVLRRMDVMFDAPPPWLRDTAGDIATLVQHFDKFVARAGARLVTASAPADSPEAHARDAERNVLR